ncbi:MAG: hypothetical protein DMF83_12335 [Acidobacteria bacterium]|nr:MAG: hypothetical protein DMF83_12335 [Acidobacteriota bacterium]
MAWTRRVCSVGSLLILATAVGIVTLCPSAGRAQITFDGTTTPPGQPIPSLGTGPTFNIGANLGRLSNPGGSSNLFHSFQLFNLTSGQRAIFSAAGAQSGTVINNVIGRVTGGPSTIDGTIQSTITGANFYFFNPRGVAFGPNGRLDVPASFYVSTGDYLKFADNVKFSVKDAARNETLSSAAPTAFGFLGATTPAPISIQGTTAAPSLLVQPSAAPLARTLSIVGGDITITGPAALSTGTIQARGGLVQIVSVKSVASGKIEGEVSLASASTPDVTFKDVSHLGAITLANGAVIDAGGRSLTTQPSGMVLIRGDSLQLGRRENLPGPAAGASILSNTTVFGNPMNPPIGAARAVDIRVSGAMSLDTASQIISSTGARGQGGGIVADVASLSLTGGSQIVRSSSSTRVAATGGVTINATESIRIDGASPPDASGNSTSSGISTSTLLNESIGGVTITGGASLTLTRGGNISTSASGAVLGVQPPQVPAAAAGPLDITAGVVSLSGRNPFDATKPTGIVSSTGVTTAVSGNVSVNAASLSVTEGAVVQSGSNTTGQGGSVTVTSAGPVLVASGGAIVSQTRGGNVQEVNIKAPSLTLDNGLVRATTQEAGKGGDVTVEVVGTFSAIGGGAIKASSEQFATGAAGNVTLTARGSATMSGAGSGIFSTTAQFGKPGTVKVETPALSLSDGAQISVSTNTQVVNAPPGDITLNVGTLGLSGGARIDSGTTRAAHGGNVTVTAGSSVDLSASTIASNTTSTGAGGNITIHTPQLTLTDHATISATSTGTNTATAGSIALMLGDSLRLQDSAITTASTRADGGNVSITTTGSQFYLLNGKITTSVQSGVGEGGNITIGAPGHPVEFVILNGSEIRADAFGGPGGNINIFAGIFLTSNSILSASSALGLPGTIGIQAGVTDVSSSVGQLPESVLQAATLLRAACATRLAGGESSSLVVSGREGVPAEPGGALPSPLVAEGPADSPLSLDESPGHDDPSNRIALWVPAPRCLR